MPIAENYRLKLPCPGRAFLTNVRGTYFWMAANSRLHAKRMSRTLYADMEQSARLRLSCTMDNGHVGVGHAGVTRAKRGFKS